MGATVMKGTPPDGGVLTTGRFLSRSRLPESEGSDSVPVLIIAGAQKSGTTSVGKWFADNGNGIQLGVETLALDGRRHRFRTRRVMSKIDRAVEQGLIPIVKRPEIFHNPVIRERASLAFPDAVALAILRNPVERTISAWRHGRRLGGIEPHIRISDCLRAWETEGPYSAKGHIISFSLYSGATEAFMKTFASHEVAFSEDVIPDPRKALKATIDRLPLRVAPAEQLPVLNSREAASRMSVRPSGVYARLSFRWDTDAQYFAPRHVGYRIGTLWRLALLPFGPATDEEPQVTEEEHHAIFDIVRTDFAALEDVLGRRLPSGWYQP
jgi:hypothetical protein